MAATNEYKIQMDKLEGPEDWAKWKWHISMVLRAYGLEDIIDGSRKCPGLPADATAQQKEAHLLWQKDDAKAASLLASALGKSVAELVLTCKNAVEIWTKLCARFERSSTQRLNMLIESFFRVTRDEKEDVSAHVARLQKLFVDLNDELKKHNENTLSERILNGRILSTLGKEYDNFKDLWDTIPSENHTVNLLIEKLCAIELRDQVNVDPAAFVARGGIQRKYQENGSDCDEKSTENVQRARRKFPCHKCKRFGHWAADCPEKNKNRGTNKNVQCHSNRNVTYLSQKTTRCDYCKKKGHNESQCFNKRKFGQASNVTSNVFEEEENNFLVNASRSSMTTSKWILDSGCTSHLCNELELFDRKINANGEVKLANGDNAPVRAKGNVSLLASNGRQGNRIVLENALYVQRLRTNLLSVAKIVNRNHQVLFTKECAYVTDANGTVKMIADRKGDLFYLREGQAEANCVANDVSNSCLEWHRKLGHLNYSDRKRMLKRRSALGLNFKIPVRLPSCNVCTAGKISRIPFSKREGRASAYSSRDVKFVEDFSTKENGIKDFKESGFKETIEFDLFESTGEESSIGQNVRVEDSESEEEQPERNDELVVDSDAISDVRRSRGRPKKLKTGKAERPARQYCIKSAAEEIGRAENRERDRMENGEEEIAMNAAEVSFRQTVRGPVKEKWQRPADEEVVDCRTILRNRYKTSSTLDRRKNDNAHDMRIRRKRKSRGSVVNDDLRIQKSSGHIYGNKKNCVNKI